MGTTVSCIWHGTDRPRLVSRSVLTQASWFTNPSRPVVGHCHFQGPKLRRRASLVLALDRMPSIPCLGTGCWVPDAALPWPLRNSGWSGQRGQQDGAQSPTPENVSNPIRNRVWAIPAELHDARFLEMPFPANPHRDRESILQIKKYTEPVSVQFVDCVRSMAYNSHSPFWTRCPLFLLRTGSSFNAFLHSTPSTGGA